MPADLVRYDSRQSRGPTWLWHGPTVRQRLDGHNPVCLDEAMSPTETVKPVGSTVILPDPKTEPTISVPRAGAIFGLSRPSAYEAAKRGDIPTIRMGRRIVVPTAKLLAMLGLEAGQR